MLGAVVTAPPHPARRLAPPAAAVPTAGCARSLADVKHLSFRLFGVPVRVEPFFFVVLVLLGFSAFSGWSRY